MMKMRLALLAALFHGVLLAGPAQAGLFDDDEARNRIETLRRDLTAQTQRLDEVAATATSSQRNQLDVANQLEQLKNDQAKLRGQIEVLSYELESAQKRQQDFYIDLDSRLRKLEPSNAMSESGTETTTEAVTASSAASGNLANLASVAAKNPQNARDPAAEMRDYETALTLFKGKRYKEALAAFETFIRTYTTSELLPNAHYWAATTQVQLHQFAKAAEMYARLVSRWPQDAKAPDALLGQANSLRDAGDAKAARQTLEQLVKRYPGSNAAQTARARLSGK